MKIDFYISSLSGGGAEKVLTTLAKAFATDGDEVTIVSLEKRPQFYQVDERVKLVRYKNEKHGLAAALEDVRNIRKYIKSSGADISISFLSRCNLSVLLASLFRKGKVVVCDRNNPLKEHGKLVFLFSNLLYMRADRIMVQTEQIKGFYKGFLRKKIGVIENPLDREALDKQLNGIVPAREKTILSMGRLEPQKDFKTLIYSFREVAEKYPEWQVKIFGVGDMKEELAELINSLELQNRIFLCGRTAAPFYEMSKASIFVLSSYYEGFPNVLCEAMYAGDLCISSDCVSGPRELIEQGGNGWLFPIEDRGTLSEQIEYCITHEEQLGQVRDKAKDSVKRLYIENNIILWKNMVDEVVQKE